MSAEENTQSTREQHAHATTCAHCRRDLTGVSTYTIQGIAVCADIHICLARQAQSAQLAQPTAEAGQDDPVGSDEDEIERYRQFLRLRAEYGEETACAAVYGDSCLLHSRRPGVAASPQEQITTTLETRDAMGGGQ